MSASRDKEQKPDKDRMIKDLLAMQRPVLAPAPAVDDPGEAPDRPRLGNYTLRGTVVDTTNIFGLTSKSASLYPEAYKPVDDKFWQEMSEAERARIQEIQASAAERLSFDPDKRFSEFAAPADEAYQIAQGRRHQAMKRRAPRNYEERQKEQALKRKDPLARRYTGTAEVERGKSAIVRPGPLDTPVLVPGASSPDWKKPAPPLSGKMPRPKRGKLKPEAEKEPEREVFELPTFDPKSAPAVSLKGPSNQFGLSSRSEQYYPEAFQSVSKVYWKGLTDDQRRQISGVQAGAMEKVGYEQGAQPMFIEDPFKDEMTPPERNRRARSDDVMDARTTGGGETVIFMVIVLAFLAGLGFVGWRILMQYI